MQSPAAVGVDIGGTKVLAVALDPMGGVLAEHRVSTPKDPDALTAAVAAAVRALGQPVGSLGIGVAGLVRVDGRIMVSPHLADPQRMDLRGELGQQFGVDVRVENDANAAAWGEVVLGAAHGSARMPWWSPSVPVSGQESSGTARCCAGPTDSRANPVTTR